MSVQDELRAALGGYDLEAAWEWLAPVLPQHPLTLRNHRYAFKRYLDHARLDHADVLRPDPEFLSAYLLTFRSLDPGHARSLFSRLRGLYKAFRQLGVIPSTYDPLLGLPVPRLDVQPGEARRHFDDEEVGRLLTHADGPEERCLILLGSHAGLKSGEVCALQWSGVQLTEASLNVHGRAVPKNGPLDGALRDWARKHGGLLATGTVFAYKETYVVNTRLHRLCARAGVRYRPFTALRSAYALRLWQTTHDPRIMVEQLGIGSLKAVEAYMRMEKLE
ncbi:tyrosine-type recombinase/integrase (plasmid) [Deinococcus radiomollis]|uniref:tyrosine-type recombinase/integrase n=1 Tax=Deinococcus radiomollis TaxID=468916 RepID=UPI00389207B4